MSRLFLGLPMRIAEPTRSGANSASPEATEVSMRALLFLLMMVPLLLSGCSSTEEPVAPAAPVAAVAAVANAGTYTLGPGDRLRINVFGEDDLSGEFAVDDGGAVGLALVGSVSAAGRTVAEFEQAVTAAYSDGYLRDPRVSVEVLNYRPYFIVGEVKAGGEYQYKAGLTVQDAVAIAGGYSYRANTRYVYIRHAEQDDEARYELSQRVEVAPGDIIRVPERFF
jgi:polysaccharide export outer membrane protein